MQRINDENETKLNLFAFFRLEKSVLLIYVFGAEINCRLKVFRLIETTLIIN